jgi:hypothetical protein
LRVTRDTAIEQTETMVRRFDPVSSADVWKVEGKFHNAAVRQIGDQITIAAPHDDGTRTITLVDASTGKNIAQFEFPVTFNTPLKGCFLTVDKQTLCNFVADVETDILHRDFDFWIGYDPQAKKVSWRTELNDQSESSLLPFASDKMRIVDAK